MKTKDVISSVSAIINAYDRDYKPSERDIARVKIWLRSKEGDSVLSARQVKEKYSKGGAI